MPSGTRVDCESGDCRRRLIGPVELPPFGDSGPGRAYPGAGVDGERDARTGKLIEIRHVGGRNDATGFLLGESPTVDDRVLDGSTESVPDCRSVTHSWPVISTSTFRPSLPTRAPRSA
ncbi:hypothetical protein C9J85_10995 [Haloferax sp. wsp5]|nr:hypothetical protein C9J85_10995 [Haloferax sp. wsp5]